GGNCELVGVNVSITEALGQGLILFFTRVPGIHDAMAALLAVGLILAAVGIGNHYKKRYHVPLVDAINRRTTLLDKITGGSDVDIDVARAAFASNFNDIDVQMLQAEHPQAYPLRRTW